MSNQEQKQLKISFKALIGVALLLITAATSTAHTRERGIILQSATSPADAGLYDHILPIFERKTGIKVHVVAVGSGQALRNGRAGDGDVLLVHAKSQEEEFVAQGYGIARFDVMHNDFVVVGPAADSAKVSSLTTARTAFTAIAQKKALFVSRGDNSGTHQKEQQIWRAIGVDVAAASGMWYREIGAGMGATLNIAIGLSALTVVDRGTWISFRNKRNFKILLDGDPELFNPYGVILVNPKRHTRVNARDGQAFIDWLLSGEGQQAIASFARNGQNLFLPNTTSHTMPR